MGAVMEAGEIPQGRLVIGVYKGWAHVMGRVKNPDGTFKTDSEGTVLREPVVGMYELHFEANTGGKRVLYRLTFSQTDNDGEASRFQERVIEGDGLPPIGTLVAVRFASKGTLSGGKPYANDTATMLYVLAEEGEFNLVEGLPGQSIEDAESYGE